MSPGFSHRQIWAALDALAERHGLSASGLARKAGLDPTTFNPSKRALAGGRQRWPSTESIAKALAATGEGPDEFIAGAKEADGAASRRAIRLADAAKGGAFDGAGHPVGESWTDVELFAGLDDDCFAIEVTDDALAPLYRPGDILIVSPRAPARPGDRVVVETGDGRLLIVEIKRENEEGVEFALLDGSGSERALARTDIRWMSRIIWVGQ
ncbi:MAG: helix-turn-helix transcriptional regulator [Methylocystis sp.]